MTKTLESEYQIGYHGIEAGFTMVKDVLEEYAIQLWIGSLVIIFLGVMLNLLAFIIIGIILGTIALILNRKEFRILSDKYWLHGLISLVSGIIIFILLRKKFILIAKALLTLGILIGLGFSPFWFYSLWFFFLLALSSAFAFAPIPPAPYHEPPAVVMEYQIEDATVESLSNIGKQESMEYLFPDAVYETGTYDSIFDLDSAAFIVQLMRNEEIRETINQIELDYAVEYPETQKIVQPLIDIYITDNLEDQAVNFIAWIKAFTNSVIDQVIVPDKLGAMVPELILGALLGKLIDKRKKKKEDEEEEEEENKHLRKLESDLINYQFLFDINYQTQIDIHNEITIINLEPDTIEGLEKYFELLINNLKDAPDLPLSG